MSERTVAAVTRNHALGALFGRNLGNQIDAPVLVHHSCGRLKADVTVVLLLEQLQCKQSKQIRSKTQFNQANSVS